MFKFRDKKEIIGTILGSICFAPSFIIAILTGVITNIGFGILAMIISQALWLISINLCCSSLERENKELRSRLDNE